MIYMDKPCERCGKIMKHVTFSRKVCDDCTNDHGAYRRKTRTEEQRRRDNERMKAYYYRKKAVDAAKNRVKKGTMEELVLITRICKKKGISSYGKFQCLPIEEQRRLIEEERSK